MTFYNYGLRDFRVEYWTGAAWLPIFGAQVSANNLVMRGFDFAPVNTSAIRIYITAAADGFSRLTEVEAFATVGGARVNVALAANGAVASASSTYSAGYSAAYAINGERAGANWGNGGGWNDATVAPTPDWYQVNFADSKTIDRVVVTSVQDNYTNPVEPTASMTFNSFGLRDFRVEYWSGSLWLPIPGATVVGNNLVVRTIDFNAIVTSAIRLYILSAADGFSRLTEIEAYTPAVSSGVVGVRPGTPIHSVAAFDSAVPPCQPVTSGESAVSGLERVKQRVMERCLQIGDCRPGIVNISANGAATVAGTPIHAAIISANLTDINYPGTLVIHSAGNQEVSASQFTISPSSAADGYLRIGAIDQNGQQVRTINYVGGFANPFNNFVGPGFGYNTPENSPPRDPGSNYGADVDVWAPGRFVSSTTTQNGRGVGSGTSFSAPHIAALAAKVRETIANNTTASTLETLLRAKLVSLASVDAVGLPIKAMQINSTPWRARPTVELKSRDATLGYLDYPSRPTISANVWSDRKGEVNLQTFGAANCMVSAPWNGAPWFSFNFSPVANTPTRFEPGPLTSAGNSNWQFICTDPLDASVQNSANISINSMAAPAQLTAKWYINGQDHTNPNIAKLVQTTNFGLGLFTLKLVVFNADSCEVRGLVGNYNLASWLAVAPSLDIPPVSLSPPTIWWGFDAFSPTGNDWGTVGLYPNRYSWEGKCKRTRSDGVVDQIDVRTHVTVQ